MQRKKITKKVTDTIEKRCNNFCECCGVDIVTDKHHILELSEGGPDTIENLIALCPSCHRQIPKYLTRDQQKKLQEWNNLIKYSITHNIRTNLNHFKIGSNTYIGNKAILKINGQNILTPVEKDGRYYVNIIMLEGFNPQMLVLTNHVVVGGDIQLVSRNHQLKVSKDSNTVYEIFQQNSDTPPIISMEFEFNGKQIIVNDDMTQIPGMLTIRNSTFKSNGVAIDLNL